MDGQLQSRALPSGGLWACPLVGGQDALEGEERDGGQAAPGWTSNSIDAPALNLGVFSVSWVYSTALPLGASAGSQVLCRLLVAPWAVAP